ncbi:hypothetical protein BD560DRAFT_405840 [Blakeslea trispora]|nr:hypothetical protein BD560DRAFT_405840 [Blakeslea trispora]
MEFDISEKQKSDQGKREIHLEHYNITCAESRTFFYRKWLKPFKPTYELEWQEQQWLQLDSNTSQHIERMRTQGFSRMIIRNDQYLRRHVKYSNPHELDVLLELSFNIHLASNIQKAWPDLDYQRRFSLRRVFWWRSKYGIGEAYLPQFANQDPYCNHTLLETANPLEYTTPPNLLDNAN